MGQYRRAATEYELVLSGKNLETANKKDKGKVSLQVRRPSLSPRPSADGDRVEHVCAAIEFGFGYASDGQEDLR